MDVDMEEEYEEYPLVEELFGRIEELELKVRPVTQAMCHISSC
jgi:hypothetical protein